MFSFYAELPKAGSYRFELTEGKPAAGRPPRATVEGGWLTLDNAATAIRLPAGKQDFAKPLTVVGERAAAMQNLDHLEQAGIAFGPIAGVRLANGRWLGGSYFAGESSEAWSCWREKRSVMPDCRPRWPRSLIT